MSSTCTVAQRIRHLAVRAIRLRRRNSTRSMPRSAAAMSNSRSRQKSDFETARPAIGARRRLVGDDQRHIHAHMRDAIGPGHDLRNVARRRGAVGAHIGADIGEGVAAQREDGAVARAGDLQVAFHVARVIERRQVLAPILDPLDRAAQQPRRKGNEKILGIKLAARAEAAADVVFDHAHRRSPASSSSAPARGGW